MLDIARGSKQGGAADRPAHQWGRRINRVAASFPRVYMMIALSAPSAQCCQGPMHLIGDRTAKRVDVIPGAVSGDCHALAQISLPRLRRGGPLRLQRRSAWSGVEFRSRRLPPIEQTSSRSILWLKSSNKCRLYPTVYPTYARRYTDPTSRNVLSEGQVTVPRGSNKCRLYPTVHPTYTRRYTEPN
jgi:hypothetical protein